MSKKHAGSYIRKTLRLAVFLADGGRCFYCREPLPVADWLAGGIDGRCDCQLDHVVPGGGNDWKNLVACCGACNQAKRRDAVEVLCVKRGLDFSDVSRRLVLRRKLRSTMVRNKARDILYVHDMARETVAPYVDDDIMRRLRARLVGGVGLPEPDEFDPPADFDPGDIPF